MKLEIIPLAKISEGTRFREDYGEITELVDSITKNGLIQPIAVGLNHGEISDSTNLPYILIAGGRRFRACKLAKLDHIPVRIYERVLTPDQFRSIELEENVRRKELGWQETLALEREIHDLQVKIKGVKTSTSPDAAGHSLRDTAKLLNKSHSALSVDRKLSKAMTNHPNLPWEQCKNKSDANKLLKKVTNIVNTKILATKAEKKLKTGTKLARMLTDSYIIADCLTAMTEFPANTFNFAEVDPPYGISLKDNKQNYKDNFDEYVEPTPEEYPEFLTKLYTNLYRIMAPNSWIISWFAPEPWFEPTQQAITNAGFKTHRMCGIWVKPNGQTNNPNLRLGNSYEMFFYASKGNPKLKKPGRINTFNFAPVAPQLKIHPAERPIELIQELLQTFAAPNSRVIVPFAGSGKTLIACAIEKMLPIGYDLVGEFKDKYVIEINKTFNNGEEK